MATVDDPLILADAAAWRRWLDANEGTSDGVWLALAKKGVVQPTSLTYAQALDEALCSGWIDGQKRGRDADTFLQRFTPRRRASLWSERNIGLVGTLEAAGRLRQRGRDEIARAQADGRWERAYAGAATATVPDDLAAALAAAPAAAELFADLDGTNRYAVLHRVATAPSATSRANRIAKLVGILEAGETPYPRTGRR
ncbi:YdeI/OmpD-associated family protein [Microbacterium sp. NPDC089189]|uniref:YdeI/OmpD-associated family protein n=1 Tax=Microbacterium sp. NPDC089189 TaxID=3154972 RepID=UPI003444734E